MAVDVDEPRHQDAAEAPFIALVGGGIDGPTDPRDGGTVDVDDPGPVDRPRLVAGDDGVGVKSQAGTSQDVRNASCSGVSVSMLRPSTSSFVLTTRSSISRGRM